MASVQFKNLEKHYDTTQVVKGIDLSIKHGEFIVLLGPSGCGKSTTLRMLAGLEDITSGEILIGDEVVNELHPIERNIAMVFQSYALYPHMTVAENIGFSLENLKIDKTERKVMISEIAEILELTDLLDRKPKDLSGGQRQRVAMGRAMVRSPEVFLFDEPLSNLDAKLRGQMRKEIKRLHQRVKTTVIYVTHDQVEAMTLADRVVILNQGKIEQIGTPKEIYEQPRNMFVARFIGSPEMNIIKIDNKDIVSDFSLNLNGEGKIHIGIRPQQLYLKKSQVKSNFNDISSIRVNIINYEVLGSMVNLFCQYKDKVITVQSEYIENLKREEVDLFFSRNNIHIFDENNNRN
ncbi:sn-glycerol-3-phosphate ABC transporter ATP-binding protein UgpC [Vibrio sp. S17_S38]|uniref:ABC transporter ATP-binding protein n=1 Tax=Vibrio sp. S17_S38 TaxID=2720229 RepID=UPI00167FE59C|nr:sn-glycerol-3-phosphate ABC transporter ATP-binding protein UgpC [Vibrio sp. S17_S38]MBD1572623.1 sn-glycerol-3-phosphate ABC transporter ATP-binding protein UgpC [Vibrio sp. S17_S38]